MKKRLTSVCAVCTNTRVGTLHHLHHHLLFHLLLLHLLLLLHFFVFALLALFLHCTATMRCNVDEERYCAVHLIQPFTICNFNIILFCILDKSIIQFGQIQFKMCKNTFFALKCICPDCTIYLSKLQHIFVQIAQCIWP